MSDDRHTRLTPPNSWLVPAVVTTLCCFPVTGVVGVYYASQVRVRWEGGDHQGALVSARRARFWTLLAFVAFVAVVAFLVATGSLVTFVDRVRD